MLSAKLENTVEKQGVKIFTKCVINECSVLRTNSDSAGLVIYLSIKGVGVLRFARIVLIEPGKKFNKGHGF